MKYLFLAFLISCSMNSNERPNFVSQKFKLHDTEGFRDVYYLVNNENLYWIIRQKDNSFGVVENGDYKLLNYESFEGLKKNESFFVPRMTKTGKPIVLELLHGFYLLSKDSVISIKLPHYAGNNSIISGVEEWKDDVYIAWGNGGLWKVDLTKNEIEHFNIGQILGVNGFAYNSEKEFILMPEGNLIVTKNFKTIDHIKNVDLGYHADSFYPNGALFFNNTDLLIQYGSTDGILKMNMDSHAIDTTKFIINEHDIQFIGDCIVGTLYDFNIHCLDETEASKFNLDNSDLPRSPRLVGINEDGLWLYSNDYFYFVNNSSILNKGK